MCGYTMGCMRDVDVWMVIDMRDVDVGVIRMVGVVYEMYEGYVYIVSGYGYLILILLHSAPAITGAFYFFNNYQSTKNDPRYLAPSSTSAHKLEPLYLPKQISNNSTHSKAVRLHISPLLIHLFPQRYYQILRSLSPSRMPLARLNLTAIWCHSSGI